MVCQATDCFRSLFTETEVLHSTIKDALFNVKGADDYLKKVDNNVGSKEETSIV